MTITSWPGVPPGMPMHHHCVVSVEPSHHPKHWVDASTAAADLVAWQYPDAVQWVHDQLVNHYDEATRDRDGGRIDDLLDAYLEAQVGDDVDHYRYRPAGTDWYCPTLWERLPQVLQMGRWVLETFQLAPGRKLVLQILGYADTGQPEGVNGKAYVVCRTCTRPAGKPYLGLTDGQKATAGHLATV